LNCTRVRYSSIIAINVATIALEASMTGSEMTLARYYAKQAVKEEWKRQGLRPHHIVANHLNQAAENYFDQHREKLIARACAALAIFAQKGKR
jgi:hypothetical protein